MNRRDDDFDYRQEAGGRNRRGADRDVLDLRADRSRSRPQYFEDHSDGERRPQRSREHRGRLSQDEDADRPSRRPARDDEDDRDGGPSDDRLRRDRDDREDRKRHRTDDDDRRNRKSKGRSEDDQKDGEADEDKDGSEAEERRKKRRPLVYAIGALVLLLLVAGGLYYWLTTRDLESTDDAFTDGRVINIAPQIAGQVVSLDITDNQFVHKGDPLIHIDSRTFIFDRDQSKGTLDSVNAQVESQRLGVEIARKNFPSNLNLAKATLASSQANLTLQSANLARQKSLPKQATTQQDIDQAQSSYEQATAQVEQDQAKVSQAEPVSQNIGQSQQQVSQLQGQAEQAKGKFDQSNMNVEWTVVRAPQDGHVTQRNVEAGNYVAAGQQFMTLVTPEIWVTANFKETQLDRMRPGQHVDIKVDAYPDLKLAGHVDSVQRGSGSRFSAFPAQNATGNYVKIVQRVPVKIIIDSGLTSNEALPIGVSVVPTVTVR